MGPPRLSQILRGGISMPAPGLTFLERSQTLRPHEVLIFFVLLLLFALSVAAAQVIIEDVDDDAAGRRPGGPA